jgi:hypothetical protein
MALARSDPIENLRPRFRIAWKAEPRKNDAETVCLSEDANKIDGNVQNAIGRLKDTLKGK